MGRCPLSPLHFLLPLTCLCVLSAGGAAQSNPLYFPVGVVLDRGSWPGDVGWSCINMSLDDFYAENHAYSTKLKLYLRDSGGTSFGAASAATDLVKNLNVKAIIGPQSSTQAKFVMALGAKTHVPIISFSAKSPSLSSVQTQYFIRTAFDDTVQAKAIASLVKYFNWRQVVPIFEDTEYGNGIIPSLIDDLQANEVSVPYRGRISLSATKEKIHQELENLKVMQTRVFVVHMSISLGFRLFSCVHEAGMMDKGYVWIVTYGLTDILNYKGLSAIKLMQGVLGLKPYFHETLKLRTFKTRWKKEFQKEFPGTNATEPSAYGLWAYDTLSALAKAVERTAAEDSNWQYGYTMSNGSELANLGESPIGPKLLDSILHTDFIGLSGKFQLINGKLNTSALEIVNVIGNGSHRVGFWTETSGISRHINSQRDLKHITWPGDLLATPKGWEWPTNNKKLRIGIPVKPGFTEFLNMDRDPITHRSTGKRFSGYCIEVFDAVMSRLPYHVPYEYIPFEDSRGNSNGSYDELVYQVYLKNLDAAVGDITIIANRSLYVDFTLPFTESGVIMAVPIIDYNRKNAWAFMEPMSGSLWFASGLFFLLTGIVIWVLEHRINDEFRGPLGHQLGTIFHFSFSTLVFAHRERLLNNLSKIVVVVWFFVVLVLTSSYTASLTSMLTVQRLMPTITDMKELIRSGQKVGYPIDSFMPELLKRMGISESNLKAYSSPEEYNDALSSGEVAAIVDEIPYVKVFLSKFCGKYTMTGRSYNTDGFGFVFPKGSPLVADISRAILNVTESDEISQIESKLYQSRTCPDQTNDAESSSLTLNSFWGLFLITGTTSAVAAAIFLASFLYNHWQVFQDDGISLWRRIAILFEIYDRQDPSSAPRGRDSMEERTVEINVPYNDPSYQSPSSLSAHTYANTDDEGLRTPLEGGETPRRETGGEIVPPLHLQRY